MDATNDTARPMLIPCADFTDAGELYCSRHAEQTPRQDAMNAVLDPTWAGRMYAGTWGRYVRRAAPEIHKIPLALPEPVPKPTPQPPKPPKPEPKQPPVDLLAEYAALLPASLDLDAWLRV
jgi:hypothetical protein